eukprot:6272924-Prymnesium_polylepis.1
MSPDDHFERVGADLWYRHEEPMDATSLAFCAVVPTIEGCTKKWVSNKLTTFAKMGQVAGFGDCLPAALGFDRSGWGEAIVKGKG